jgi:hypothetical protein
VRGWIPAAFGVSCGLCHALLWLSGRKFESFVLEVAFRVACFVMEVRMYRCKILKDSVSPEGKRLTTFEIEFPRVVLAEVVTHRMNSDSWAADTAERTKTPDVSKNSASSRAIPLRRMIEKVMRDPYIPDGFPINQPGMQATLYATGETNGECVERWLQARDNAVSSALSLCDQETADSIFHELLEKSEFGTDLNVRLKRIRSMFFSKSGTVNVHKQEVNRLLEPWGWIFQVVTATEWDNFFALRCDEAAAPAFRKIARIMYVMRQRSTPKPLRYGEWHLPYVDEPTYTPDSGIFLWSDLCDLSAARCAWTSYWPPDGGEGVNDLEKAKRTLKKLRESRPIHASPFEHQACPMRPEEVGRESLRSNLRGWVQYRKLIHGEATKEYRPSDEEVSSWGVTGEVLRAVSE